MDVVVEGGYAGNWRGLFYKLTKLDIPDDIGLIDDGIYKYAFYGKIDYLKISELFKGKDRVVGLWDKINNLIVEEKPKDRAMRLGMPLAFQEGNVFGYDFPKDVKNSVSALGLGCILDRPRLVCLSDGRIYIDESMKNDKEYIKAIPMILFEAYRMFYGA